VSRETHQFCRIAVPDAELYYCSDLVPERDRAAMLRRLIDDTPWRQESVTVWGKTYPQPRLTAWYGDPDAYYTYSGITLTPIQWSRLLLEIKERVEIATRASFNSVLLNYYRDDHDSMGLHSDDEPELGPSPIIASVSLGEERTLVMKHRLNKTAKPARLRLASGSVLLMKGETQRYWKHGVGKETHRCGPRVNLTFRRIVATSLDQMNTGRIR
jgi:alkylated DNA repair dioxygenase AlkB